MRNKIKSTLNNNKLKKYIKEDFKAFVERSNLGEIKKRNKHFSGYTFFSLKFRVKKSTEKDKNMQDK